MDILLFTHAAEFSIRSFPPPFVLDFLCAVIAFDTRHPQDQATYQSLTLDLAPGSRCKKGRTSHAASPGLVVNGFEQTAVEGDVDPPR